jgi:hypothetical protein
MGDQESPDGGGSTQEPKGRAKQRGPRAGVEVRVGGKTQIKKEYNWKEEDVEKAVLECFGGKGTRKLARDNHVPKSTLQRRLKGEGGKKGAPTVLPWHVEEQIVEWIKGMHEKAMSTNRAAVNLKIKEILEFTKQDHPFRFGVPGEKWWKLFLGWWPELTERKGQPLDKGRAMAMNAQAIRSFFVKLRKVVKEKNLTDKDIWN